MSKFVYYFQIKEQAIFLQRKKEEEKQSPFYKTGWYGMNTTISNIRSLVANFPFLKFSWVRRTCNSAAHVTARLALRLSVREISLVVLL